MWKLPPNADQRLMMQSLLADRFKMRWHIETKEGSVFFLVQQESRALTHELVVTPAGERWVP